MKKLLCAIMVFSVVFPIWGAYAIDESQYIGTWVYTEETLNCGLVLEVLYLRKDHKLFYLRQFYDNNSPTYSWKSVYSWYPTDQGVRVKTGEDSSSEYDAVLPLPPLPALDLYYLSGEEYKSFVALSSDMLSRMADKALNNLNEPEQPIIPAGLRVPQGEYLVGDLIPAGRYLVTLSNDDLAVIWVQKPDEIVGDYFSLVYSKGETEAYIILEEGDKFKVQHSTVILSEPKGF